MDEQRNVTPSEDSMLRAAARRSAKVVSQGRMTMDELPPLPDDDRAIIELAREHAPVVYTNRHFPDTPAFSFPTRKLLDFARAYAAAEVAKERERCLAEIETGIWIDKTTSEILDACAAAIRAGSAKS